MIGWRLIALAVLAAMLSGCGGLWTLRVSGWGVNAELAADYRQAQDANRDERPANAEAVSD